jgi:hypothetical protein
MIIDRDKTAEEFKTKLAAAAEAYDVGNAHMVADDLLCELLTLLNFEDVVDEYRKIDKWYA